MLILLAGFSEKRLFTSPSTMEPSPEGDGILYHLRRDLMMLYGPEKGYGDTASQHAMLAMMGIFAGIDYLSKIYSPHQGSRNNGKRFVQTVQDLWNLQPSEAEAFYQLRCSLVHSVALSTLNRSGTRFIFQISDEETVPLIDELSDIGSEVTYRVSFRRLKEAFIDLIMKLENISRDPEHLMNGYVVNMIGQMHREKILKT